MASPLLGPLRASWLHLMQSLNDGLLRMGVPRPSVTAEQYRTLRISALSQLQRELRLLLRDSLTTVLTTLLDYYPFPAEAVLIGE